jgi:hypothetical protein
LTILIPVRNERFCGFIVRPITLQKWLNDLATFFGAGPARPTLVIWGHSDPYIPVRYAERQRDYFPRAQWLFSKAAAIGPMLTIPKGSQRFCCHF